MTINIAYSESIKLDATALFNRLNGMYYGVSSIPIASSQHNDALFIARSVQFDFSEDVIEGNIIINSDGTMKDDFRVIKKSEQKNAVTERNLNMQAEQKITKKYPLVTQLNLLVKAVNRLGQEHDLLETEEFEALGEMVSYINQCIQTNQAKKEFYANNPEVEYFSDERVYDEASARMEGGVHEALGARPVTGGSVFGSDR